MPLNSSGGAEKTSQLCLSPWGLRGKSGAPLRGGRRPQQLAGSAGPVSGQIPIFKPAAGDRGEGWFAKWAFRPPLQPGLPARTRLPLHGGIAGHELGPRAVLASPYSALSVFLNDWRSRTLPTPGKGATRTGLSVPSGRAPAATKPASLRSGKQPRVPAVPRKPRTVQT